MHWTNSLSLWRKSRGFTIPQSNYVEMVKEELQEYVDAGDDWHEQIDSLCDQLTLTSNQIALEGHARPNDLPDLPVTSLLPHYSVGGLNNDNTLYAISDRLKRSLREHGVIVELAMKECLKEISSRTGEFGPTGKWEKYTTPEAKSLWYKANYDLARAQP